MNLLKTTILAIGASALIASTANAATAIRCSHQLPPKHHIAKVIDRWAAEVEAQAGDELDIQIFGANSLVGARKNIVATAKGDIECAFSVSFQWGKTLPIMTVTVAPFAFGDLDMWRKWPDSEAASFLTDRLRGKGVQNLVWLFTTNTSVFTSNGKNLVKPEDFQGIKIRGLVPAFNASLKALGAAPVSMSGSKVYEALSTGVIDAGLTDVSAAVSRKYYEVQDHFTVAPLMSVYFHGYMNVKVFDGLSDKAKAALASAGKKAAMWAIEASDQAAAAAPGTLREKGGTVHIATKDEVAALAAVMRPAFDKAFAGDDPDSIKMVDLIKKLEN